MSSRGPIRARPVAVTPRRFARQINTWAEGIESLAPSSAVSQASRGAPALAPEWLVVVEELDDWIVCRPFDDATARRAVAKPYKLRGDTATRTVNGEDQEILPAYAAGDLIAAAYAPGGSGLGVNLGGGVIAALNWYDQNVDARAWAESAT